MTEASIQQLTMRHPAAPHPDGRRRAGQSDMQMPNLNGIDATREIRRDLLNQATPILAMTANACEEDRQACLAVGGLRREWAIGQSLRPIGQRPTKKMP